MESSNYIVSQLSVLIIVRDFVVDKKMTMTSFLTTFKSILAAVMLNLYTYNMGNGNLDATKHARSLSVRAVSKKFRHFSSILFFVFADTTLYHGFISCIPSPRFNFSPPISTRLPHSPPLL